MKKYAILALLLCSACALPPEEQPVVRDVGEFRSVEHTALYGSANGVSKITTDKGQFFTRELASGVVGDRVTEQLLPNGNIRICVANRCYWAEGSTHGRW